MLHRHLTHEDFTLAAIDDVIARGRWEDWKDLRRTALSDAVVMGKILRVCKAHVADPYALRYHFWRHYVEEHTS